jgi:hypothetical protein
MIIEFNNRDRQPAKKPGILGSMFSSRKFLSEKLPRDLEACNSREFWSNRPDAGNQIADGEMERFCDWPDKCSTSLAQASY